MKQFSKILKFELLGYLKNKVFIGITLFLVVAIAVVMFIPNIAAAFEEDEDVSSPSYVNRPILLVTAEKDSLAKLVQEQFSAFFPEYAVKRADSAEALKEAVTDGSAKCGFHMHSASSYTYYVNNLSMYDMNAEIANEALIAVYRMTAMIEHGISAEEAAAILSVNVDAKTETLGKDQMQNFFYTYMMIFALYMVILLYGQMVATSVATEKSSRAMEVLITSAKPTNMMFGKVLAACLAGLIQLVAVFGTALVFYRINQKAWGEMPLIESFFNIPIDLFFYMLIFFILGFLIYAFLYGAIGSTASKLEDVNTSVMPITFLFIIAFIVVMTSMTSGAVDNTAMLICSYIPFTSPMAMFTRIAMSTVAWYEIAASIAILIASTFGIGILSAKIYRTGVLLYGKPPKLLEILKTVFSKTNH